MCVMLLLLTFILFLLSPCIYLCCRCVLSFLPINEYDDDDGDDVAIAQSYYQYYYY